MTLKQKAMLEIAKMIAFATLFSAVVSVTLYLGYGAFVGTVLLVAGICYMVYVAYLMKLDELESKDKFKDMFK
jgi:hypothetical protein